MNPQIQAKIFSRKLMTGGIQMITWKSNPQIQPKIQAQIKEKATNQLPWK